MTAHVTSLETPAVEPRALRDALGRFATGVTVVTTRARDGAPIGLTCNSFASVSLDPPLVLWSLRRESPALPAFEAAGRFVVNVLAADQEALCRRFATPMADRFAGIETETCPLGCPVLPGALAVFACRTTQAIDGGDHVVFLGAVREARTRPGEPLVFAQGRLGGFAPFAGASG